MMRDQVALKINFGDVEVVEDVDRAETHQLPSIAAIFFVPVSDILLLLIAAMCGLMETLCRRWTNYFSPAVFAKEAEMLPRPSLGFIVTALIALAEIKSQGQTGFPFQTHPQAIMICVTSLLVYGLASAAEHIFSPSELGSQGFGTVVDLGFRSMVCTMSKGLRWTNGVEKRRR